MVMKRRKNTSNKGFVLIMTIFAMLFASLLIVATSDLLTTDILITNNLVSDTQALYVADAGIEYAIAQLRQDANWTGSAQPVAFPTGSENAYTVTSTEDEGVNTISSTAILESGFQKNLQAEVQVTGQQVPFRVSVLSWQEVYAGSSSGSTSFVWTGTAIVGEEYSGPMKFNPADNTATYFGNDLSWSTTYSIVIDEDGNAWAATIPYRDQPGGAYKHDGNSWVSYSIPASARLGGDQWRYDIVRALKFDENGRLWIGSQGGLTVYDGNTWQSEYFNTNWQRRYISAITIDSQGNVWAGAMKGFYKINNGDITNYDTINSSTWNIRELAVDSQDNVWITSQHMRFSKYTTSGAFVHYTGRIPGDSNALCVASDGKIWVGASPGSSNRSGVSVFDPNLETVVSNYQTPTISSNWVDAIGQDSEGNMWVATTGGLCKYDGNTWMKYDLDNSELPATQMMDITFE